MSFWCATAATAITLRDHLRIPQVESTARIDTFEKLTGLGKFASATNERFGRVVEDVRCTVCVPTSASFTCIPSPLRSRPCDYC